MKLIKVKADEQLLAYVDTDDLLDLEKPLVEQKAKVIDALRRSLTVPETRRIISEWQRVTRNRWCFGNFYAQNGEELHATLIHAFTADGAATWLKAAGIPGIRFHNDNGGLEVIRYDLDSGRRATN